MKPRFVRTLTDEEHQSLARMKQQKIGRVSMRAHLILLSDRGYTVPQITDIHSLSNETVYKWFDRFDEEGPGGLYDREREGRPPKLDEEAEKELRRVLQAPPTEEGYQATRWTTPQLAKHLEKELDVDVHPETVRDALQRLQFSFKRPRRSLPEDPAYAERIAEIDQAIASAAPETTILFEDETEFKCFPPLRRAWMPTGEQRSVEVPKQNGKFALYGTLDIATGEVITEPYPKGKSDHTKAFLRKVLGRVEGRILLIWDNASWHVSKTVGELLEKHDRLEVLLLPKRSPKDNPIEDIWRHLKNVIAANLERSLDALKAASRRFFSNLSPEQALRMAGLSHD